jgi:flagellar motor protein MotB
MRGDDFRVSGGLTWSPQPKGIAEIGRGDRDGDGLPDVSDSCMEDSEDKDGYQDDDGCPDVDNDGDGVVDANDTCPDEPEDRDAYQDDDGCPERDNDGDGISDVADRCPDGKEDKDDFEDDDGCLDEDNDGDGIIDDKDQCPNDAETVNNVDDGDGCPDTKVQTGPEETTTGINLKGAQIEFTGKTANLTNASKTILGQVGKLINNNSLRIRVEVHVPLGTTSKNAKKIRDQKKKDKDLAQDRADAIVNYLTQTAGVSLQSIQGVGIGSDRPLSGTVATDPLNERVDFVKTQQRNP